MEDKDLWSKLGNEMIQMIEKDGLILISPMIANLHTPKWANQDMKEKKKEEEVAHPTHLIVLLYTHAFNSLRSQL